LRAAWESPWVVQEVRKQQLLWVLAKRKRITAGKEEGTII